MARGKLNRVNSLNFSRLTTVFESLPLEIVLASSSARIKALKLPRETVSPWKREGRGSSRVLGEAVRWERWRRERERGYSESAEFVNEKGGNERAKQARFSNREANSFRRNEGKEGRGRNGRILIKKKERKKGRFSTSLRMVIRIAEEEEGIN